MLSHKVTPRVPPPTSPVAPAASSTLPLYGHKTTAMHDMSTSLPLAPRPCGVHYFLPSLFMSLPRVGTPPLPRLCHVPPSAPRIPTPAVFTNPHPPPPRPCPAYPSPRSTMRSPPTPLRPAPCCVYYFPPPLVSSVSPPPPPLSPMWGWCRLASTL